MKKGKIPEPESFESVSIFLCDIVAFTSLASESTAHQIVDLLNTLYNLFDMRLENYDVYKVETIGDAYMVASGVPEHNDHHAGEIAKMALDLLAKVVTFEVQHKPGYRLRLRMGIHSGTCVAGVVGTKIPHYSVFGETVEIAGIMEATGEPMKIQVKTIFRRGSMTTPNWNLFISRSPRPPTTCCASRARSTTSSARRREGPRSWPSSG